MPRQGDYEVPGTWVALVLTVPCSLSCARIEEKAIATNATNPAKRDTESQKTTDHEDAWKWIESRGGKPATVKGTESGQAAGLLRVEMPASASHPPLTPISWYDFFEEIEEENLAFLHQEHTADKKRANSANS